MLVFSGIRWVETRSTVAHGQSTWLTVPPVMLLWEQSNGNGAGSFLAALLVSGFVSPCRWSSLADSSTGLIPCGSLLRLMRWLWHEVSWNLLWTSKQGQRRKRPWQSKTCKKPGEPKRRQEARRRWRRQRKKWKRRTRRWRRQRRRWRRQRRKWMRRRRRWKPRRRCQASSLSLSFLEGCFFPMPCRWITERPRIQLLHALSTWTAVRSTECWPCKTIRSQAQLLDRELEVQLVWQMLLERSNKLFGKRWSDKAFSPAILVAQARQEPFPGHAWRGDSDVARPGWRKPDTDHLSFHLQLWNDRRHWESEDWLGAAGSLWCSKAHEQDKVRVVGIRRNMEVWRESWDYHQFGCENPTQMVRWSSRCDPGWWGGKVEGRSFGAPGALQDNGHLGRPSLCGHVCSHQLCSSCGDVQGQQWKTSGVQSGWADAKRAVGGKKGRLVQGLGKLIIYGCFQK